MRFLIKRLHKNPPIAQMVADMQGVPVDHLLDTIRRRKEYRDARMFRARSRKRHMENAVAAGKKKEWMPFKRRPRKDDALYAGEGELHALIRASGISQKQFCELVGINASTFTKWYGHPLHDWPIRFMRLFAWQQNARIWMEKQGIDPNRFNAALPTEMHKAGRYPRKPGDLVIDDQEESVG